MAEAKKRKSLIALALLALFLVITGVFVVVRSGSDRGAANRAGSASTAAHATAPSPSPTPTVAENPAPTASAADLAQEPATGSGSHGAVGSSGSVGSGSGTASSGSGSGNTGSGSSGRHSLASSTDKGGGSKSSDNGSSSNGSSKDETASNAAKDTAANGSASAQPEVAPPAPKPAGKVSMKFQNAVGNDYRLIRLVCVIDGATVATKTNPQIPSGTTAVVYSGPLDVGSHKVGVFAEYQGNGGMFSYFSGYKFKVQSAKSVAIAEDRTSTIVATAVERGGPTVAFEDRLALNVSVH